MFEYNDRGIRISGTSLWLDAVKKVDLSFVSHAHADHIKKHKSIIATPPTIHIFQHRKGKVHFIPLDYHQSIKINDVEIELLPAGHILGSAQIRIEKDGMSLLYSGDINTSKSETAEKLEYKNADILIIESTFGKPHYKFPPKYEVIEKLVSSIERCFRNGIAPVILSYSLGKSQEIIKILGDLNYEMLVHSSIYHISKIYEEFGIELRNYKKYEGETLKDHIMLIPPHLNRWIDKKYLGSLHKIFVSGWALDKSTKYRFKIDEAIPLSDHADYNGLIRFIHNVDPKKIFITHGFDDFAIHLKKEGFNAQILNESSQISLF